MNDVVLAFGRGKVVELGADCLPESILSSCSRFPEQSLELGKELLDRVEIRGIGREVKHAGPCRPDRLLDPGDLVNSQVIPSLDDRNSSARSGPGGSRREDACFASEGFSSAGLGIRRTAPCRSSCGLPMGAAFTTTSQIRLSRLRVIHPRAWKSPLK